MTKPRQSDLLDDVEDWNAEDESELAKPRREGSYDILVSARDWTVATMVQQIQQGNIDLDPAFQRRNAWKDQRRSRLLESFILGFPVPQIVLAENPHKKKTFIVIDGKQRLMTVAGLYLPEFRDYWSQPRISGLQVLDRLNRVGLDAFLQDDEYAEERRQLSNADIRTTVVTGFKGEDVLYDIFYRINTGSVPLSSQELRQVLNRGAFAMFLLERTSTVNPLWTLLRIDAPDARLRDVELLLRLVAWKRFSRQYTGNMKPFLDETMRKLNENWHSKQRDTEKLVSELLHGVQGVIDTFGDHAGRKYKNGTFEPSLNRAIFEVEAYYFSLRSVRDAAKHRKHEILAAFKKLSGDAEFLNSVEATTKSIEHYRVRFGKFAAMLRGALDVRIDDLPLGAATRRQ